jgi:enterochelin esterase family protein
VFYLLHGGGDEDSGWSTIGRAGFILDNLIAEGKAVPMLVVMPNGSLPGQGASFERELMADVIPEVERHFRVLANPESRAIAGLSMGGGHTWINWRAYLADFAPRLFR